MSQSKAENLSDDAVKPSPFKPGLQDMVLESGAGPLKGDLGGHRDMY